MLPEGILEYFDVVRVDEEPSPKSDTLYTTILHIHLDFPIRDRKVVLHVRRRRWINGQGKNTVLDVYPLMAKGTRYSQEFADFFKEEAG